MNTAGALTLIGVSYIVTLGILGLIAMLLDTPKYQEVQGKGLGMTWGVFKSMTIAFVGGTVILLIFWMSGGLA